MSVSVCLAGQLAAFDSLVQMLGYSCLPTSCILRCHVLKSWNGFGSGFEFCCWCMCYVCVYTLSYLLLACVFVDTIRGYFIF